MALVNEHFLKLPGSYLFSDIAKKVNTFKITHPKQDIIRLGIGDVTQPLPKACIEAMHKAVEELASKDTFRGYGPEQGYDFLIEAIIKNDFIPRGIHFSASEIFVSDGAKSDTGNIGDILRHDNSVGVTDPIYPVYIDSNVMCGRAGVLEEETGKWSNVTYMPCTSENNFIPEIPDKRIDIVYLCYPNNPTGTTLTKPELKKWVDYALANDTLILFDAAYEVMKYCFVMIPEFSRIHGGLSLLSVPAYSKQPLEGQKPSSFFLNSFVWSFKSLIDLIWFGLKIIKKKTQIRQ
jgi:LL-diaminopimelate aminotransferase